MAAWSDVYRCLAWCTDLFWRLGKSCSLIKQFLWHNPNKAAVTILGSAS